MVFCVYRDRQLSYIEGYCCQEWSTFTNEGKEETSSEGKQGFGTSVCCCAVFTCCFIVLNGFYFSEMSHLLNNISIHKMLNIYHYVFLKINVTARSDVVDGSSFNIPMTWIIM